MLEFDGHADYSNYRRDLDLERAVASVRYKIGEVNYTRTIFTSLVDNALIIRIEADKPGAVNFTTRYSTPYKEYEIKKEWQKPPVVRTWFCARRHSWSYPF